MIRNPKPVTIALITSIILACSVTLMTYLQTGYSWKTGSMVFFTSFIICLIFIAYALEFFLYRKIKLIYKTIHSLKTHKFEISTLNLELSNDPILAVNKEVLRWADDRKKEIEELQKLDQFRKEFLGNVSHELKTPIFNIQGYIHTLIDGAIHDPDVNMNFLQKAAKSADRLSDLVNDLLVISQLESGQLEMEYEDFDINALVKDVYEQLEERSQSLHVTLGIKEGCNKPCIVRADKYRIRQVLVNLISNAIKYNKQGGWVLASYYDMDQNVLIEISDSGEGIPEEHLSRIFERFYRVDKSRSRETNWGGTGLGLAIVKHIMEAHTQSVHVRSSTGIGTTFGITLKTP